MKRSKGQKSLSNKKRLILSISAVCIFALVGLTLAVSHDTALFRNIFGLVEEEYNFTEDIPEPLIDWQPCQEKEKYVTATNNSGSPKYVRLRFDEQWRKADDVTELPLTKDGVTLAHVNFADDWEDYWELRDDGYYHYKTPIAVGETTRSLLKSVTLDCDSNFGAENVCVETATGQECTKPADDWEESKYHLKVTGYISDEPFGPQPHIIDCLSNNLYDTVACQAPTEQVSIDFRRGALATGSDYDKNGNGVNKGDEFQKDIYYYRGQIDNNYLLWANKCWRIVRTTATGGVKIVYIGEPDGSGVCPEEPTGMSDDMYSYGAMWNEDPADYPDDFKAFTWTILGASYDCNEDHAGFFGWTEADCYNSLADIGYMIGERKPVYYDRNTDLVPNGQFATANNIAYINGQYVLDPNTTTIGDYYNDEAYFDLVLGGSHYSCFSMATTCETAYMIIDNYYYGGAMYIELKNGELLEDYLNTVYSNHFNSPAKTALEDWYHKELLAWDNDVEDAVFCNDRTLHSGTIKSKDEGPISSGRYTYPAYFDAYARNTIDINGNFHPNLACSKNDAFTVSNEIGNGKNNHKVGLLSSDELTFAGINANGDHTDTNFLDFNVESNYTMSPAYYASQYTDFMPHMVGQGSSGIGPLGAFQSGYGVPGVALRPVVSLKQSKNITSGDGTRTNPYHLD